MTLSHIRLFEKEEPVRSAFEGEYRKRILAAHPKRKDGKTLFPFRRLFLLAGK
ncbi:MAG: hypothetical protein ACTSP0_02360 [Alphaproteobacteria bacterium]